MTCGAPTADDTPCQRPAGWGRDDDDGRCRDHADSRPRDGGQTGHDGRPYGDVQIRRILDALEDGATRGAAARAAGVSPRTLRRWTNDCDELEERVIRAEAEAETDAVGIIRDAAAEGDWRAAAWLAEKRFGYGDDGKLPPDEVRAFVEAVKGVIDDELDDRTARRVTAKIGDALEELEQ